MTDIVLLPCPHCSGKAELHTNRIAEDAVEAFVMCSACFATTDTFEDAYASTGEATAAWNRRTSPSQVAPANPAQVTDAMEYMVQQFLRWKLPDDFNPDGGISFDPIMNLGTEHQSRREPVGTNLFDYQQAKAMVHHMLEGLSAAIGAGGQAVAVAEVNSPAWLAAQETLTGTCAWCRGTGSVRTRDLHDEISAEQCPRCGGQGIILSALFQPHSANARMVEACDHHWEKTREDACMFVCSKCRVAYNGNVLTDKPKGWTGKYQGSSSIATHPSPDGQVAVKPLKWSYDGGGDFPHYWGQSDAFPSYGISQRYNRYILQHPFGCHLNSEHGTLEAAKAAAQADYERRILSALSQPHPADERVVEALRHPLEAYADSYAQMAREGDGKVYCRSVEVDIRQNMIPVTRPLSAKEGQS